MAKDRFSKFKKSFYSNEFRYGTDPLFEKVKSFTVVKRPTISKQEKNRIKLIKNNNLTDWERNFINNVIALDKSMTLKQKKVLINLENKYKK